jgi:hypothetical protein
MDENERRTLSRPHAVGLVGMGMAVSAVNPARTQQDDHYSNVTGKYAAIFPAMRKAGRVAPGHGTGARHGAEETSTAERARVA